MILGQSNSLRDSSEQEAELRMIPTDKTRMYRESDSVDNKD